MWSWLTDDKVVIPALSTVGGGLAVAGVTWLMQHRKDRKARHAERLLAQIDNLYGPLHFRLCENADLLKCHKTVDGQYTDKYITIQYSEKGHKTISEEADATIAVMNAYTARCTQNNDAMVEIITGNFALIIEEDLDAFRT